MNEIMIKVIGNYSYQTTRCLGEGVYGKVYEGIEKETKEKVAIKKIDLATFTNDKYLENAIFSQIYLLKRFNHLNIVKFKDVLSSKNSLYIITEFCKNGDLKEVLKKRKFKEEDAFEVLRQILNGFSELVRERIVHRDLKPANILINEGVYKIGDFGFAKYVDNFGSQMLKSCVGSPIYMAPQILQRTPYTTKCDIWSIGVIFYEMMHNCPPWKAKDENQLLRGIKNISISQILRKSNLSSKAIQFLKRTLTYSEEQRIGWAQLFQNYGLTDKNTQSLEKHKTLTKQKQRVISANSSTNLSSQYSQNNTKLLPLTPISSTSSSIGQLNSPTTISPQRKRSLFPPSSSNGNSHPRSQSIQNKKPNHVENVVRWRQFLMFYHYYCVEIFGGLNQFIGFVAGKQELYARMLLSLAVLVKHRSTFCLSMIAIHSRTIKAAEQLYKAMKIQHESYEMVYTDIVMAVEKLGLYKQLKAEIATVVGQGEVINEERMEKMQGFMSDCALINLRLLVQTIKQKQKQRKSSSLSRQLLSSSKQPTQCLQTIDNILDLLHLSTCRQKQNKTASQIITEYTQQPQLTNNSTPQIKIDQNNNLNNNLSLNLNLNNINMNNDMINLNMNANNVNISSNRERKSSVELKDKEKDRERERDRDRERERELILKEGKEWGDTIARDSFGLMIMKKYEKVLGILAFQNNNTVSCGIIKG